jgi:hypothetical protein
LANVVVRMTNATNQMAFVYCLLSQVNYALNSEQQQVFNYAVDNAKAVCVEPEMSDDVLIHKIRNYIDTMDESDFFEMKSTLETSRDWRRTMKPVDDFTHDMCQDGNFQHVLENKWGPLHRSDAIQQTDAFLRACIPPRKADYLAICGAGSDYAARIIEQVFNINGHFADDLDVKLPMEKHVFQASASTVKGRITAHSFSPGWEIMAFPSDPEKKKTGITLVTDYNGLVKFNQGEEQTDDRAIRRLIAAIPDSWCGVGLFAMTMPKLSNFTGIFKAIAERGWTYNVMRHPRRHNDHFFIVVGTAGVNINPMDEVSVMKWYFKTTYEIVYNNKLRNFAMATGIFPKRKRSVRISLAMCYAATLMVKDEIRGAFTKESAASLADKKYLLDTMKKMLKTVAPGMITPTDSVPIGFLSDNNAVTQMEVTKESVLESEQRGAKRTMTQTPPP